MALITNIAIVISAAGTSKRMGTPKQLLKWGTTTLLEHAIETALQLNGNETIVVLGANFNQIKKQIDSQNSVILNHSGWESGLGSSIAFGIKYLLQSNSKADGVLIMLADQPLIDVQYLKLMVAAFEPSKGHIVATSYDRKKQGVPALFDKTYFDELIQLQDDKGAKTIIEKHVASILTLSAPVNITDIDTPEDYETLYRANHQ